MGKPVGSNPDTTTPIDKVVANWSGQENPKDKNFKNADNPPKGFAKAGFVKDPFNPDK